MQQVTEKWGGLQKAGDQQTRTHGTANSLPEARLQEKQRLPQQQNHVSALSLVLAFFAAASSHVLHDATAPAAAALAAAALTAVAPADVAADTWFLSFSAAHFLLFSAAASVAPSSPVGAAAVASEKEEFLRKYLQTELLPGRQSRRNVAAASPAQMSLPLRLLLPRLWHPSYS